MKHLSDEFTPFFRQNLSTPGNEHLLSSQITSSGFVDSRKNRRKEGGGQSPGDWLASAGRKGTGTAADRGASPLFLFQRDDGVPRFFGGRGVEVLLAESEVELCGAVFSGEVDALPEGLAGLLPVPIAE